MGILFLVGVPIIIIVWYLCKLAMDGYTTFTPTDEKPYIDNGPCYIHTEKPTGGETIEEFSARLMKGFNSFGFEHLGEYNTDDYNSEYYIAGLTNYTTDTFITFGIAGRDLGNKYSSRAIALINYQAKLIGFIPEKILDKWYQETEGEPIPVIMWCYREGGRLYGRVYTYEANADDYPRMLKQYLKLLKMHS